jgi:anthranilate phosphoribosyltransferase
MVETVREFLKAVGGGAKTSRALTREEARAAMALIVEGKCAPEQLGAFLMALRMKGETADELAGFVEALEPRLAQAPYGALDVDAHGDGHEGRASLLPAAACAAASLGVPVLLRTELASPWAKHGLADSLPPAAPDGAAAARALASLKLAVLDLPSYAPALARLVSLRALFGRRTVAQTLCKLIDPLRCARHLVGVFHAPYLPSTFAALETLSRKGLCVQALGGLPEATPGKIVRALPANLDLRSLPSGAAPPDDAATLSPAQQNQQALDGAEPALSRAAATCALMLHAALDEPILDAAARAREALASGAASKLARQLRGN